MNSSYTKVLYKYFTSSNNSPPQFSYKRNPWSALKESLTDYHTVFFEAEYSGECHTPKLLLLLSSQCQEQNINQTITSSPHPPSIPPSLPPSLPLSLLSPPHHMVCYPLFIFYFPIENSSKVDLPRHLERREIVNFSNMVAP